MKKNKIIVIGIIIILIGSSLFLLALPISSNSPRHTVNALPDTAYNLNYSFVAGGSGVPFYVDGYIFLVDGDTVLVYTTSGTEKASLSCAFTPTVISSIGYPYVVLESGNDYQTLDISNFVLSVEYSESNTVNEGSYTLYWLGDAENGNMIYTAINTSTISYPTGFVEHAFSEMPEPSYSEAWINESIGGIIGFALLNIETLRFSTLMFSDGNIPYAHYFSTPYTVWSNKSFVYNLTKDVKNATPTFVPILNQAYIVNNNTIAIFGDVVDNLVEGIWNDSSIPNIITNASVPQGIAIFNFNNMNVSFNPLSASKILPFNYTTVVNCLDHLAPKSYEQLITESGTQVYEMYNEPNLCIMPLQFSADNYVYTMPSDGGYGSQFKAPSFLYVFSLNSPAVFETGSSEFSEITSPSLLTYVIANNSLIWTSNGYFEIDALPFFNPVVQNFLFNSEDFYIGIMKDTVIMSVPSSDIVYDYYLDTINLNIETFNNIASNKWALLITDDSSTEITFNNTESGNINITVPLFPATYNISIESSYSSYVIYDYTYKSLADVSSSPLYLPNFELKANLVSNSILNITFCSGLKTLTVSETGLIDENWGIKLSYGNNPSNLIINNTNLPLNELTAQDFTIYSTTLEFSITFLIPMHTYSLKVITPNQQYISTPNTENINLSNNMTIQLNFSKNYPHANIEPLPKYVPIDTAIVISQNSTAGINTSITSYNWTILLNGTHYSSYKTATIAPYFNQSGNYTIELTVINSVGLSSSDSAYIMVEKFHLTQLIHLQIKQIVDTSNSIEYLLNVSVMKNETVTMAQMIIDSKYGAQTIFINETGNNTRLFYNYAIYINPAQYLLGLHSMNFSAYDSVDSYTYSILYLSFGKNPSSNGFNLINMFGGPTNFWAMVSALIGVILLVASLKVSRTSDVIIETGNGKESILKAKPVKESTAQKIQNFENRRKLKKKNKKNKGGK